MHGKTGFIMMLGMLFISLNNMAQYVFSADKTSGCDSLTVKFSYATGETGDTIYYEHGTYDTAFSVNDTVVLHFTDPIYMPVFIYVNDPAGFADTTIYINVYRTVPANFMAVDTASVSPGAFYFEHTAPTEPTGEYTYIWAFGDGNTGAGSEIFHTYSSPGTYTVSLSVSDTFGCQDISTGNITVNIAGQPGISASVTEGCDSLDVIFSLENVDTDTITSVLWDFGNGTGSNLIVPPVVRYFSEGPETTFDVFVVINGTDTISKQDYISVYRTVNATFACFDTLNSDEDINLVCRTNDRQYISDADYSFDWQFEGIGSMVDSHPLVTYPDAFDTVTVSLMLTDETHGCSSMSIQQIFLYPEVQIQNVFTPNNDQINDFFRIQSVTPLRIKIFNRYGLLIFQADGTELIWDGKTVTGSEVSTGVYFYIINSISDDQSNRFEKTGFIHLFR